MSGSVKSRISEEIGTELPSVMCRPVLVVRVGGMRSLWSIENDKLPVFEDTPLVITKLYGREVL